MRLFDVLLRRHCRRFVEERIHFHWVGCPDGLPPRIVETLLRCEEETRHFDDFHLCLAINYSGRDDVLRAIGKAATRSPATLGQLSWDAFAPLLDTGNLLPVDLFIRTSGEQRLSNFYLLQCAYAELYFTPCLWPDFNALELQRALDDYSGRRRRFGKIAEEN
jgi:undecaprenyl diphosphate synthase